MGGSNAINEAGVSREKGLLHSDNYPGARRYGVGCYENTTNEFWLFSGTCFDLAGNVGEFFYFFLFFAF